MAKKEKKEKKEVVEKTADVKKFTIAFSFDDGIGQLQKIIATFINTVMKTDPGFDPNNVDLNTAADARTFKIIENLTDDEISTLYVDIINSSLLFTSLNNLFYRFDPSVSYHERNTRIGEQLDTYRKNLIMVLEKYDKG